MPQASDSGELNKDSHIALIHVAFPIVGQGRHSRTVISELNTAPMHALTNASPRHHWSSTHSSGPERIATPYSAEDLPSTSITRRLTSYSMPVLTGAFPTSLSLVSQGTQRHRVFPFKIFFSVPFVISERYIPYFTPMIPLFSVSSVISVRDNLCAFCLPHEMPFHFLFHRGGFLFTPFNFYPVQPICFSCL